MCDTVTIYLHGIRGQRQEVPVVARGDGWVKTGGWYPARYRTSDGRRIDEDGAPTSWDFWRLEVVSGTI